MLLVGLGCSKKTDTTGEAAPSSSSTSGASASGDGDTAAPATTAVSNPILLQLESEDATPAEARPDGVSVDIQAILDDLAYKGDEGFRRPPKNANTKADGCQLSASLVYAVTANGKAVKQAEVGEARAGILASLDCRRGEEETSFRAEVEHFRPFDAKRGTDGPTTLTAVVTFVSRTVVHQLVGQYLLRGADDAVVLETLRGSDHPGKLMEAALEAGERKLEAGKDALVKLTRHPHPTVAMRAAAALGLLRANGDDVVAALVAMTRGPDIEKHFVAVNVLGDIGGPTAARYLSAIAEGHPEQAIRQLAREAAQRAKPTKDPLDEPVTGTGLGTADGP